MALHYSTQKMAQLLVSPFSVHMPIINYLLIIMIILCRNMYVANQLQARTVHKQAAGLKTGWPA